MEYDGFRFCSNQYSPPVCATYSGHNKENKICLQNITHHVGEVYFEGAVKADLKLTREHG